MFFGLGKQLDGVEEELHREYRIRQDIRIDREIDRPMERSKKEKGRK